jgi:hypothetical protein
VDAHDDQVEVVIVGGTVDLVDRSAIGATTPDSY